MKISVKNYSNEQLNIINKLAQETGILGVTAKILYSRGYDTPAKINDFLTPNKSMLHSPFDFHGMTDAVSRIELAKQNVETVVIFGDYDADGICATTLLYNALKEYGIEAITVIPERDNGYGLSEEVINEIVENVLPDLLITVDCGISCKNEVDHLKDLGVDVIVTDHHELPEELPDTTVITCKLPPYPYDLLSGTGVAYKLASALIGARADRFLDLVAIATIADSMPLTGENRVLVRLGVDAIKNGNTMPAVNELITISGVKEITATSLAFSVTPRINAAGRMGDAYSALQFFLATDKDERDELLQKLVVYNAQRQAECEELHKLAKLKLSEQGVPSGAIVLADNAWKSGLLGIVAARLCEEYRLPTVLFAESESGFHGSARSLGDVNVYEAISSCSELLTEFGGHAQAAGVGIKKENLELFRQKLSSYINENYSSDAFEKSVEVDAVIDNRFTTRLAKEVNLLEPFGTGNKKPVFMLNATKTEARPIKEGSPHLTIKTPQIDLMYFNGINSLSAINSGVSKNVLFESSVSVYNGREYVKGMVKSISYDIENSKNFAVTALRNAVKQMVYGSSLKGVESLNRAEIEGVISSADGTGFKTAFIVTNPQNLREFPALSRFEQNPLTLVSRGSKNAVIIGADVSNLDLSEYEKVVFVDKPLALPMRFKGQTQIVSNVLSYNLSNVNVSRESFGEVFKEIVSKIKIAPQTVEDIVEGEDFNDIIHKILAIETFIELGFIVEKDVIFIDRTVKKELTLSKIYKALIDGE